MYGSARKVLPTPTHDVLQESAPVCLGRVRAIFVVWKLVYLTSFARNVINMKQNRNSVSIFTWDALV